MGSARFKISKMSSVLNFSSTITRHRLKSAEFKLNDGFSVVAPISVITPLSTCGKNISLQREQSSLFSFITKTFESKAREKKLKYLLKFIEAMDFIHEQNGFSSEFQLIFGSGDSRFNIIYTGHCGR